MILPDVTVAVHEYGSDRITNSKTKVQVQANIVSTFLTILKFWDILILNPKAIIYRAYVIVKNCYTSCDYAIDEDKFRYKIKRK